MCGICGFTGAPEHASLRGMADAIVHRGPDDAGYWEGAEVSLAMRRLAIIDLETGQQPVFNEDDSIGIVFNGEIYNHLELRADLERRGHHFRTHHSDTEVLVHLYEEYGDAFLHQLNGMFAIAIWDIPRRRLLLARDRAGVKPLYFGFHGGRLMFASEIKSLLAHPSVRREPDYRALYHYFSFKNIPAPLSAFAGISQLSPGEYAVYEGGELRRDAWWRLVYREDPALGEADAAAEIRSLLEDSVRLRMRADVPFGAYLSGGVDSSSVVALMSRIGGRRVQTFSLVYEEEVRHKAADQEFARMVSRQYDTDHHEHVLTFPEVMGSIDAVLGSFDEPFSGVTSTYFLTSLIARHVKVALSGDGADELFGSYLPHRLAQPLARLQAWRAQGATLGPDEIGQLAPFEDRVDYLDELLSKGDEAARRVSQHLWTDAGKSGLFTPKMAALCGGESTEDFIRKIYARAGTDDPLNRALHYDFVALLPDQVLAFVDRLSMAHSVEVRPPFLDYRLMELSGRIPGAMKIRGSCVKSILKEAVRGLIPDAILDRPKEGFVLPVDQWLLNNLEDFVRTSLSPERLAVHGLIREEAVNRLLTEHYGRQANHGPRIWNLLMFQRWWEMHFTSP